MKVRIEAKCLITCLPNAANYKNPTYHGTASAGSVSNVDQLTNNKGVSILGALNRVVNGVQEDYLLNGSSLSHVDSLLSYMHFGNYGANTMVTELFRKNHRGVSGSVKLEYGF